MNPSDGWLTTSLIAPVAVPSLPKFPTKFVLLGSEQRGNGNLKYRVGQTIDLVGEASFDDLRNAVSTSIANEQIPIIQTNEHLHLYGWAHDGDENHFAFHLVVENVPDGQIAANVAATSGNITVGQFSGYLSHAASRFAPNDQRVALTTLSLDGTNCVALHGYQGPDQLLQLDIDDLVIDCGVIDRSGPAYTTQRHSGVVKAFSKEPHYPDDPLGHQPIATLTPFDASSRFTLSVPPLVLPRSIASGHINPMQL